MASHKKLIKREATIQNTRELKVRRLLFWLNLLCRSQWFLIQFKKTRAKIPTLTKRLNKYLLLKSMHLKLPIMIEIAKQINSIRDDRRLRSSLLNKICKLQKSRMRRVVLSKKSSRISKSNFRISQKDQKEFKINTTRLCQISTTIWWF